MSNVDNMLKINKKALRKEVNKNLRQDKNQYRVDRKGTTLAVILVLIAVVLLFVFAKQRGLM